MRNYRFAAGLVCGVLLALAVRWTAGAAAHHRW